MGGEDLTVLKRYHARQGKDAVPDCEEYTLSQGIPGS